MVALDHAAPHRTAPCRTSPGCTESHWITRTASDQTRPSQTTQAHPRPSPSPCALRSFSPSTSPRAATASCGISPLSAASTRLTIPSDGSRWTRASLISGSPHLAAVAEAVAVAVAAALVVAAAAAVVVALAVVALAVAEAVPAAAVLAVEAATSRCWGSLPQLPARRRKSLISRRGSGSAPRRLEPWRPRCEIRSPRSDLRD
jgi:hypothetical protein